MRHLLRLFILFFVFGVMITCDVDPEVDVKVGTFTDSRDGHEYKWVQIGEQYWMAENLAYNAGAGCWAYNNEQYTLATFGRLYTWEAAKAACPSGWHLATDDEWKQLEIAIGMSQSEADTTHWRGTNEGLKLKATSRWNDNGNGNGNGTDDYGFSGLPGGHLYSDGIFRRIGTYGHWWSTEYSSNSAWARYLSYDYTKLFRNTRNKEDGFSVRCVRD